MEKQVKILKGEQFQYRFFGEPAYSFKVGERVDFGAFDEVYITDIVGVHQ